MARSENYEEFIEKFKPKKTTDDCYTPPEIYEAVKDWAVEEYGLGGRPIVRPFYPGGDFENFPYLHNCVVLDNPPFSIFAKIVQFYEEKGIDYFLFAPHLTMFSFAGKRNSVSCLITGETITYDNYKITSSGDIVSRKYHIGKTTFIRINLTTKNAEIIFEKQYSKFIFDDVRNEYKSIQLNEESLFGLSYKNKYYITRTPHINSFTIKVYNVATKQLKYTKKYDKPVGTSNSNFDFYKSVLWIMKDEKIIEIINKSYFYDQSNLSIDSKYETNIIDIVTGYKNTYQYGGNHGGYQSMPPNLLLIEESFRAYGADENTIFILLMTIPCT